MNLEGRERIRRVEFFSVGVLFGDAQFAVGFDFRSALNSRFSLDG